LPDGTPDPTKNLAGAFVIEEPVFKAYAQNITPDMETGIGKWSEDDIVKAIRTGQRPDGTVIQPPMPWQMLSNLSDEDAYAIAAYLKSLPAISHKVPDKLPPGSKPGKNDWVLPVPSAWDAPRAAGQDTTAAH